MTVARYGAHIHLSHQNYMTYDVEGRLVSKRYADNSTVGGAVTTSYIWCGARICQARNSSDAV